MKVEFVATGDSIITRNLAPIEDDGFKQLQKLIKSADVSLTNLESVYPGPNRKPSTTYQGTHLGSRQDLIDEFDEFGFNIFSLANNHATDYGIEGLSDTLDLLKDRKMAVAGAGRTLRDARRPVYIQTKSARVAIIAAGSSNARLAAAADPGEGDHGRPGLNPIRIQRTHYLVAEKFEKLRTVLSDSGVNVVPTGTTAPGVHLPYPDRNMWDGPPVGGFALEGIHFVPENHDHIEFTVLERDRAALIASVKEAQQQADLVFVALHCHEGDNGTWNTNTPAKFIRDLSHDLIDAGAHAIVGSGPHMLRGIELYKNRPICYSLGNFIFTLETLDSLPIEVYEQVGLQRDSTVSDFYDKITGYAERQAFWETVLPQLRFEDGEFTGADLIPVTLGYGKERSQRGCPVIATKEDGTRILEHLTSLSRDLGTELTIEDKGDEIVGHLNV